MSELNHSLPRLSSTLACSPGSCIIFFLSVLDHLNPIHLAEILINLESPAPVVFCFRAPSAVYESVLEALLPLLDWLAKDGHWPSSNLKWLCPLVHSI